MAAQADVGHEHIAWHGHRYAAFLDIKEKDGGFPTMLSEKASQLMLGNREGCERDYETEDGQNHQQSERHRDRSEIAAWVAAEAAGAQRRLDRASASPITRLTC